MKKDYTIVLVDDEEEVRKRIISKIPQDMGFEIIGQAANGYDAINDLKQAGKIKAFGVSNFDPFKFEALHEHTSKQLVTNQIEISPLQFEHFNSGMLDLLQKHRIHPMIWSPLAGGAIFNSDTHEACALRNVLKPMADKYQCEVDTLVYAWLLHHPVKAAVISGSQKIERLQNCVNALQINLEREDWFEIYLASAQQVLR